MKIKKIGFIGLGNMGHHMALHIAKKGYEVFPYDININTLKNFKKNYLKKENDLLSSLANIDCVILIVPSSKEVFNIVFKELKLSSHLRKGTSIIDMSTSIPTETKKIANKLKKIGINFFDCPVAGGVKFAKTAQLALFAGGGKKDPNIISLLQTMGNIIWCGKSGDGHAVKALSNFINASILNTYLEAIITGLKFGINKENLLNAIDHATTGKNHPYFKKIKDGILSKNYQSGFTLDLLSKDVMIAKHLITRFSKGSLVSSNISNLLENSKEKLGDKADQLKLFKLWTDKI